MMKRAGAFLFIAVLVFTLFSFIPTPAKAADKQDVISSLNQVLCGIGDHDLEYNIKEDVSQWSDEALADIMDSKLYYMENDDRRPVRLEDSDSSKACYALEDIQKLSRECFGLDYPEHHTSVKNNRVYFYKIRTEGSMLYVQNYCVRGDTVTAVGIAVGIYNTGDMFQGYFQASFRVNSASRYGYTLTSIQKVNRGKVFYNLKATASSELVEDTVVHRAERVVDGDITTAWVEGVSGVGKGEWLKLASGDGSKMEISAVKFSLGYQKTLQLLDRNGYPTQIRIETEDGLRQTVDFMVYPGSMEGYDCLAVLDRPVETSWIKFTILDGEMGSRYTDTCISELQLISADSEGCFSKLPAVSPDVPDQTEGSNNQQSPQEEEAAIGDAQHSQNAPGAAGSQNDSAEMWIWIAVAIAGLLLICLVFLLIYLVKK